MLSSFQVVTFIALLCKNIKSKSRNRIIQTHLGLDVSSKQSYPVCTKTFFTPRLIMKKQTLAQDAFKLYAEKFMSLEDIARQLHLNERTLRRWKKADNWETKRDEYLRTKTTLHSDLYDFTRSLINSIEKDMDNNDKVEPARYYAVTKMLKLIGPVKSYEDEVLNKKQKTKEEKPKGLTPDVILEIEEQILGITHEEICEHDLNTD